MFGSIGIGNRNINNDLIWIMEIFVMRIYIILETIILTVKCVLVVLGLGLVTGILYRFGMRRMLYGFAIMIVTFMRVAGVLRLRFIIGMFKKLV